MNQVVRIYKMKDVDMLMTSSTIAESALNNEDFLSTKRTNWKSPFFSDLSKQIDTAFSTHLGVDSAKQMRRVTQDVLQIQGIVLPQLAELKIQIIEDFKDTPIIQKEILNTLGFQAYHSSAQKGDQEALINLLYAFQTNIESIDAQLIEKGIAKKTIEDITQNGQKLKDTNIIQENKKGQRKEITAEGITAFNAIYSTAVSICRIATKFYKDNPALKEQFSFTKVSKNLNHKPKK